jgi:hypothetical protein
MGFLLTAALLSVYPPGRKALVFLSFYFTFFGIVVYFILALGNYFQGIGGVTPEAFEYLSDYARRNSF